MSEAGADPVDAQTGAVLDALDGALTADAIVGVWRYGSAVVGGLRPDSDLDLFGVLSRRLTDVERRTLVERIVPISWRSQRPESWRPVELTLVVHDDVRPWRYPPRLEFQYGEWLRAQLIRDPTVPPPFSPDLALLLTMVRATGLPIRGPKPPSLLDPVPREDVVRAILEEAPTVLLDVESDTRNVLLTLARMWLTVETGRIDSKDRAAGWAIERLPASLAAALRSARNGYLGEVEDRWDDLETARSTAEALLREVRAAGAA